MATTVKITKKDRYNEIIKLLTGIDGTGDLIDFCEAEIAHLDQKSEKAKEKAAEKKGEVDLLAEAVKSVLTADYATIADVTAAVGDAATEAKVRYRLNALVDAGLAEKTQVSIGGGNGVKARKLQAYRAIVAD